MRPSSPITTLAFQMHPPLTDVPSLNPIETNTPQSRAVSAILISSGPLINLDRISGKGVEEIGVMDRCTQRASDGKRWNVGFRKNDQLRAVLCHLANQQTCLIDIGLYFKKYWSHMGDGNFIHGAGI